MNRPATIAIVGTGLIGGSLGLAIKRHRLARTVIGVSRTRESIATARRIGAIDTGSQELSAIQGADMVVLCLPVGEIIAQAPRIVKNTRPDCVICDAGSTKEEITHAFARLTDRFIGSHPMAGSEKRGIDHASPDLFRGSLCIVTPGPGTDKRAQEAVAAFWGRVCAKVVTMKPREHDRIMAFVSHLPHATAFALVNTVPDEFLRYSASGFKDTTRLGASDEAIWKDIFFSNRRFLIQAIDALGKNLRRIKAAIREKDTAALHALLAGAKNKRRELER